MTEQVHLGFVKNEPDEKIEVIGDTDGNYVLRRWSYIDGVVDITLTSTELRGLGEIILKVLQVELKGL